MKKFVLSALLLLFVLVIRISGYAQDYRTITSRIDSLADLGLPKSVLVEVGKLRRLAERNHNAAQEVRAAVYQLNFQSYVQDDVFVSIVDSLKAEIKASSFPAKPVLQSLLAEMYWKYEQQNRYRLSQRSTLSVHDADFTRWDFRTLMEETAQLYQSSLVDSVRAQQISIATLSEMLEGDTSSRRLRPTLYDFLAHRALDFFTAQETGITRPKLAFRLSDPALFGDSHMFTTWVVMTRDTASVTYQAIRLLQALTRFHLGDKSPDALLDVDLRRLSFLNDYAVVAHKDALYLKALNRVVQAGAASPVRADALFLLGKRAQLLDSLVTAADDFKKAMDVPQAGVAGKNSLAALKVILQKQLSATVEDVYLPDKPILALMKYRNVPKARVILYRLNTTQFQQMMNIRPKYSYNDGTTLTPSDSLLKYMNRMKSLRVSSIPLPDPGDYREHATEFKIDALPLGIYLLVVRDDVSNEPWLIGLSAFKVSGIGFTSRVVSDSLELRVMNRETGAPLANAKITVEGHQHLLLTDAGGRAMTTTPGQGNHKIYIWAGKDTLLDNRFVNNSVYRAASERVSTILFTDRNIYRPGQTVYFKGLQLKVIDGQNSILPNTEVTVTFRDNNRKTLSDIPLRTNEYGTFAGSFVLPDHLLNGVVMISTPNGSKYVRVEEYKRPTFEVAFVPVKKSYGANEEVSLQGSVHAFSGYGLSQARVVYHITRQPITDYRLYQRFPRFDRSIAEVLTDTIKTNDRGQFTIKFNTLVEDNPDPDMVNYQFNLTATVTDGSGETRTATTHLTVGKFRLKIDADVPARIIATDSVKLVAKLNNLDGVAENGMITLKISRLTAPAHTLEKNSWTNYGTKIDQFSLSREDFKRNFPYYPYANEADPATWAVDRPISEETTRTVGDGGAALNLAALQQQPSGTYRLLIAARNEQGDTASITRQLQWVREPAKPALLENWLVPIKTIVNAGESALFDVGADGAAQVLMETFDDQRVLSSKLLTLTGEKQQRVEVPVDETKRKLNVQFLMIYQNRLYTKSLNITVRQPDKELAMKFVSFRDKLAPGQKEQWKLQISAKNGERPAAELVAELYDASLDRLVGPDSWKNNLNTLRPYVSPLSTLNWNPNFTKPLTTVPLSYHDNYERDGKRDYEHLDMMGYNYYGSYNGGYQAYLNGLKNYARNAALVLNGYAVSGTVLDENNAPLVGATIKIRGTKVMTATGIDGKFKLKVPKGGVLDISYIGYQPHQVTVKGEDKLTINLQAAEGLDEVVAVGYGSRYELKLSDPGQKNPRGAELNEITINEPVGNAEVNKVYESVEKMPQVRFSADTVTYRVDDYGEQAMRPINPRANFAETAFFYPQLHTDDKGQILIDFKIPESLTRWRFKGFAHTKALQTGYLEKEIVTQKQLSVNLNMPRFLREGDTLTVSARLSNLSGNALKGKVHLELFNALTMQPVNLWLNADKAIQEFNIAAANNHALSFKLKVPDNLDVLTYRITAISGDYSDGEQNTLPVLANRMLVTESLPMTVRAGQTRNFTFGKLVNSTSATRVNKSFTLEYTSNPAWFAVQALPYLMEYPYECSEQIFERYYANSLGTNLLEKIPMIKQVFDQWKTNNSAELLSNLEKNQELKETLIAETPWLRDAENETEQKKRVALLFDVNRMSYELNANLAKLKERQLTDGGFPWFAGDRSDPYITRYILAGMGELAHLHIIDVDNRNVKPMIDKALGYLDKEQANDAQEMRAHNRYTNRTISPAEIHSWYTESYFTERRRPTEVAALLKNYLTLIQSQWNTKGIYEQGLIALTLLRNKQPAAALKIIRSLKETAQQSDEMGMYWTRNQPGYYWYQSPIETQSLMIELFTEAGNETTAVDELKIALLRNKQTNNWKTTTATAQACYALLLHGDSLLVTSKPIIKLNNRPLEVLKPDAKAEAGTGYLKTSWADEEVKPGLGNAAITNTGKSISWGALYWQYLEQTDKVTASNTDIHLERKYFIEKQTDQGTVLTAVDGQHLPKTGDLLKVTVNLKSGRDFEYVQLKDMRPSGTEPVDLLSTYKYQDGLYYYEVTKDAATNFFISRLNKGNYVLEYRLRVVQPGNYSTGITTVQCMYAPEFSAHSEGSRIQFKQ